MFLNRFAGPERKGFLELALLAVRADDCITSEEVQFVEELRLGLGISEEAFVEHILADPQLHVAVACFESEASRRLAYLELVALTFVDGQYDPSESHFLRQVQQAFGLDEAYAAQAHAWAKKLMALRAEAQAMTSPSAGAV